MQTEKRYITQNLRKAMCTALFNAVLCDLNKVQGKEKFKNSNKVAN